MNCWSALPAAYTHLLHLSSGHSFTALIPASLSLSLCTHTLSAGNSVAGWETHRVWRGNTPPNTAIIVEPDLHSYYIIIMHGDHDDHDDDHDDDCIIVLMYMLWWCWCSCCCHRSPRARMSSRTSRRRAVTLVRPAWRSLWRTAEKWPS